MHYRNTSIFFLLLLTHITTFADRLAPPLKEQRHIALNEAGSQTLYSIRKTALSTDYHWQSTEYYSIRINDLQAARDYGRITIGYNHYYSDMELEFANVLTPDGKIKAVKADAMQERSAGSQDFYEDRTLLVFSLPEISPGSILEFQTHRKSIQLSIPELFSSSSAAYWYQPTVGGNGARIDPVHSASYEISMPSTISLHSKQLGPFKPDYQQQNKGKNTVHRWQWKALPGVEIESSMPPIDEVMSRVKTSTSRDWSDVDQWTWALAKDKITADPTVKKIAAKLVPANASHEEKIKAVYAYIQENIRYVFAHLGRGGYEPHFAHETIAQGYGDCKDQTILAIALLKELGVTAQPSLVITLRNGKPDMDLVALYFDHMIVWIPPAEGNKGLWMDTTADRALFPGLSNYLLDQSSLIIDGQGGQLTNIGSQLEKNIGLLTMNYHINNNKHLIVDVTTQVSGIYEQNLRNWWINDNNRETSLQQMIATIFPDAKGKASIKSKVHNAENLWEAFKIESQFDFGIAREKTDEAISFGVNVLQIYRLFGDFNSLQIPQERKNRWINNQTENIKIKATMSGEANDLPAVVNNGINYKNAYFTITQSGQQIENRYEITIDMLLPPMDLNLQDYDNFYQQLSTMNKAGNWVVSFISDAKQQELNALTSQADDTNLPSQLALARYYLDQGQFEKALKPANIAVDIDNSSGESWYVLGLAQGYNAMLEESMASFAQASSLGYTP